MEPIENYVESIISKNNFITKPHNKYIICIEGNVYCGKTEFIKLMSRYLNNEFIEFITDFNSVNNINIIFHSNKDKCSNSFFKSQIDDIIEYVEKIMKSEKPIIIIEKCLLINVKIFMIYAKNKGMLTESEFNTCMKLIQYYSDYIYGHNNTHILILRSSINKCFENNYNNNNNYFTPILNYNTLQYIQNCYKKIINDLKNIITNPDIVTKDAWDKTSVVNNKTIMKHINYNQTNIKLYFMDFDTDVINNEVEQNIIIEKIIQEFSFLKNYVNVLYKTIFNQKDWITVNPPRKKWKHDIIHKINKMV